MSRSSRKIKGFIKQGIMTGLYGAGSALPKRRAQILIYHSIDSSGSCISMASLEFERQMEIIRDEGYNVITLRELVECLEKGDEKSDSVVLTFDDGFRNNYEAALPILEKFGFKATIFLATGYLGKKCRWDKRSDIPDLPLLDWDMVKEMDSYGIDFQPHTVTHPHLTGIPDKKIREELRDSRKAIEDRIGKRCAVLCYPYGEYDSRVIEVVRQEGFSAAVAIRPEKEGIFSLGRVGSGHLTTPMAFKAALKGMFPFYLSLKSAFSGKR